MFDTSLLSGHQYVRAFTDNAPLILHHLCSFSIAYASMSFEEYGTHNWALHRTTVVKLFPKGDPHGPLTVRAALRDWWNNPTRSLKQCLREWPRNYLISWRTTVEGHLDEHAVQHHSEFYKNFRHEPDEVGKHVGMAIPWDFYKYILLLAVPVWFIDSLTAYYYVGFVFGHLVIWNLFHYAMHCYVPPWFVRIPPLSWWFKLVEWHHFLHHQHRDKNFNAWLPCWDWILGTNARPTELDLRIWRLLQEGAYVDRRGRPLVSPGPALDRSCAVRLRAFCCRLFKSSAEV